MGEVARSDRLTSASEGYSVDVRFRVGRSLQSTGAVGPPLLRSAGLDYILKDSANTE